MNKEQLKEAVWELNLVDTVFEADGVSYIDTAVSVTQVYDLIDQLDEPEVLSQEWIEENSLGAFELEGTLDDADERFVSEHVLQNLIAPKKELPVVPQFVAEWIEELKQDERPLYSVMSSLMNKTNHEWAVWKSANKNFSEIVAQAWADGYEVEKEKKLYYVINYAQQLVLVNIGHIVPSFTDFEIAERAGVLKKYQLTEEEIKKYDERYWSFAVEITE